MLTCVAAITSLPIITAIPSPPNGFSFSILSSSLDGVNVTVDWDPPTESCIRDNITYTVTVSPPAQLSATDLTSTSVTVTAQYNVDYTVSVVATNCAGNSTTAVYNFSTGEITEQHYRITEKFGGSFNLAIW